MRVAFVGFGLIRGMLICGICMTSVNAQVIPDGTLKTTVSQSNNNFIINDGDRVGDNLFHSFSQFSIPSKGSAFFNNASDIQNIFTRVTGGSVSNIDGLIQANGNANLFLLNPNGIIFGQNASFNIGGSFIGTTANSIRFADGTELSATNSHTTPLLTMSVPIGLQMGSNPSPITVQGTGHILTTGNGISPINYNPSTSELLLKPGKTLALVGGNLNLTGATLNTPQGRVELGSLGGVGIVGLNPIAEGYQLDYEKGQSFADIQLTQKSLVNIGALPALGALNAGSIQLQGKHIQMTDGSIILSQNRGNVTGGEIFLKASAGIDISGTTGKDQIRSGIRSEGFDIGRGSSIKMITPRFKLLEGAGVNINGFGLATSGDIWIDAETMEISGFSPIIPTGVTALTTVSTADNSAGNLFINTNNLLVSGGAAISSVAFAGGSTGKVNISSQNITVTGDNPVGIYSNISAVTYGIGNAQTLTLDTNRLQLLNGGVVATTSFVVGKAGNIDINATESILIDGNGKTNNSSINSAVISPTELIKKLLDLPNDLSADAGTVNINTPSLRLSNGGAVSVTNQGEGSGGNITIAANQMFLDNQGSIQAQTASGEGGNITSQVSDLLLLRHNSLISTTSAGIGNGGNITIKAPIVLGLENSDIVANAVKGKGGNIEIQTQGIIGLEFRNTLKPRTEQTNDITASSEFNVNGTVQINNIGVDPNSGLVELSESVADPSQQITSGCSSNQGSSFVATGRGGIPQNPNQDVRSDTSGGLYSLRTWSDIRDISPYRQNNPVTAQIPKSPETLVQATSWHRNTQGKIEIVADKSSNQMQQQLTCAAIPQS